jgi:hypothetical protein
MGDTSPAIIPLWKPRLQCPSDSFYGNAVLFKSAGFYRGEPDGATQGTHVDSHGLRKTIVVRFAGPSHACQKNQNQPRQCKTQQALVSRQPCAGSLSPGCPRLAALKSPSKSALLLSK